MLRQNREGLVQYILETSEKIYSVLMPSTKLEWLSSDLTVAQLRVLLVLQAEGSIHMSRVASMLGIALSTATGIVDKLVKKGLVTRDNDPEDRRVVICGLSYAGKELINRLWISGQSQMERLLAGLTLEQLEKAAEVAQMLFANVSRQTESPGEGDI